MSFDWTLNWSHLGTFLVAIFAIARMYHRQSIEMTRVVTIIDKLVDKIATHEVQLAVLKERTSAIERALDCPKIVPPSTNP